MAYQELVNIIMDYYIVCKRDQKLHPQLTYTKS